MNCPHCGLPLAVSVVINGKKTHQEQVDFEDFAEDLGYKSAYDMLFDKRHIKKESKQAIADELGVGVSTVSRRMIRLGVTAVHKKEEMI